MPPSCRLLAQPKRNQTFFNRVPEGYFSIDLLVGGLPSRLDRFSSRLSAAERRPKEFRMTAFGSQSGRINVNVCTSRENMRMSPPWSYPEKVDHSVQVNCLLLKRRWTDITKIAVTAFPIVKTLDVFKYLRPCFIAR